MFSASDTTLVNKAIAGLQGAVKAALPVAQHVYALAVRQVVAEAVAGLVTPTIILIAGVAIGSWAARRGMSTTDSSTEEALSVIAMIATIVSVVAFIWTMVSLNSAIIVLYNPEWAALSKLAELVK